jgi:hypothetical protein
MCVDCVLASPRIAQVDPGDEPLFEVVLSQLSLPLQDRLVQFCDMSFNVLASAMIAQDGTYHALLVEEEDKRKRDLLEPSEHSFVGALLKYRLVYTPSFGKLRVPPPSPQ